MCAVLTSRYAGAKQGHSLEELHAMTIWERLQTNDWTLEIVTLSFTLGYVFLFMVGDYYNKSKVSLFLAGIAPTMKKNFYQFGTSANELYIKDSAENFASYASGRVNIESVKIKFSLQPRHNIFIWFFEFLLSFFTNSVPTPQDKVDIVIKPSVEYDNFISGVVAKIGMNDVRQENYYLSLTKTTDSDNLPPYFVYMGEVNEFQEKLTTPEIKSVLNNQETPKFLKFFAFTDQSSEKPFAIKQCYPQRKIILSTYLTSNKNQLKQLNLLLDALFNLVDKLAAKEISFRPESLKKIVKTREVEISKIQKLLDQKKQEEIEYEKAKLKKQERESIRKLSKEEQIKFEKKQLEKEKKKMQRKQKVRM